MERLIDSWIFWRQQLIWNWWAGCIGVGKLFSSLDFSSLKREQFKIEEQQEYFPWSSASAHNASFSSQGRSHLGPSPWVGVWSMEPAQHIYPLVLWSTKPPVCQAQHKCLLYCSLGHMRFASENFPPGPKWGGTCGYFLPLLFGDKRQWCFSTIQSPLQATRHEIKQRSRLKEARGAFSVQRSATMNGV